MLPETMLKRFNNYLPKSWKICFLSALLVGLIAHLYKITGWIPNWDSLVFRYDPQNMLGLGRWFLPVVCGLTSFYDLPFLNGLIAILFHGLGAVCIIQLLDIKKSVTAALVGGLVVAFPTVTSVLMYNYVADGYAVSFFLACLAAVCFAKGKWKDFIIGALLLALSSGIYQAYVSVTITLLLLYFADRLIFGTQKTGTVFMHSLKVAVAGLCGMLLYYGVLLMFLKFTGTELLEYQGIQNTSSASGMDIGTSLYVMVHAFVDFFFDFSQGVQLFPLLNLFIFALMVSGYLVGAIVHHAGKPWYTFALIAVYGVFLPVGASVLALINPSIDYHNLMKMGYCTFYIAFVLLYERLDCFKETMQAVVSWSVFGVASVLILNQVVIANVSYHKAQMAYEKSFGTLIRIADRIEQTEHTETCEKILVVGTLPGSESYSVALPPEITGVTDGYILRFDDEVVGQSVVTSALNDYCGTNYQFVAGREKQELLSRTEVENMTAWPGKTAVSVVDNVIVLKLGMESE